MRFWKISLIVSFIGLSELVFASGPLDTSAQVIEEVQYTINKRGQAEIQIRFSYPLQFVRATQSDKSSQAQIFMQFSISQAQKKLLPLEELRIAEKSNEFFLKSITYDGFNATNPVLSLQFKKPLAYKINFKSF